MPRKIDRLKVALNCLVTVQHIWSSEHFAMNFAYTDMSRSCSGDLQRQHFFEPYLGEETFAFAMIFSFLSVRGC